ncbi:MAG TPA: hypothetical protein VGQ86_01300 [Candidatus Limnocylindria bacterium]|jgi:class 3 adenylate cyclase|nr:hypothetical protein [Candidatus Limnocylindria bacterium]
MAKARTTDLQIRGVPVTLRDRLRRRADGKGVSMSQYVIEMLKDDLDRPTFEEWLAKLHALPPVETHGVSGAELIRELREERERELEARLSSSSTRRSR